MANVVYLKNFGSVINTIRCVSLASSKGYLHRLAKYSESIYRYSSNFEFEFKINDDTTVTMIARTYLHDPIEIILDGNKDIVFTPVNPKYGSSLDEYLKIVDKSSGTTLLTIDQVGRVKVK